MSNTTSSFNEIKIDGNNNRIYIGSKEKFEPMIDWISKKIKLDVKGVGKRYAPNDNKYKNINQDTAIKNLFNFFDYQFFYNYLQELIDDYWNEKPDNSTEDYTSFDFSGTLYEFCKTYALKHINENEVKTFIDELRKKIEEEKRNILCGIELAQQLSDDYCDMTCDPYTTHTPDTHDRYQVDQDISLQKEHYKRLENMEQIFISKETLLYEKSILLIIGEALIGKTHLFCDVALNRIDNNKPTLLFFGNMFDGTKTIISNMIVNMGLGSIKENEFLEGLNKWGEEYNTRTLIMIDAINETENSKIWQDGIIKFCEQIKSYPNLALTMSVRDVEINKIITPENGEYIANEIVEVEHKGFEGIELEAVRTFCEALKVEFPKVPIHTYRLFVNPGMLFLYIETIKNSTKKIDTSIINPLTIFTSYIEDLERKYYQKYPLDIDEDDEIVSEAIKKFISLGTKQDYIHFYLDYIEVKKKLKSLHVKILEFLISEGVLNKLKEGNTTKVYFTYQKFENFFIADYLLGDFKLNKNNIFTLIREHHGAISEALFMQIPETLGKEIFDLNVWFIRDKYICEQYLQSLIWRRPFTINDNTFKFINFILGFEDLNNIFLDTMLQLSNVPSHPLNIVKLHKKLLKFNMSERDYNWSIYIHNSFRDDGIVKKILNWAWDKKEEFEIEDESLYLYGLTLGWFLTSSNRALRDGATKALVNLFTDSVDAFLRVLQEFETVDDLYVLERLYAVGYGIILRSSKEDGFKELGEYISNYF